MEASVQTENREGTHQPRPAQRDLDGGSRGASVPLTSDSLMHIVSCQPSSGGDSGRNTQSAPQAKPLTRARYLCGNSKDLVRLPPAPRTQDGLGVPRTAGCPTPPGGICYGCRALHGLREGLFHLSGIYPHVPAVSPHNFQNEGPLVTAKETGNVHLPPLGAAESSTHSQAGPKDHFIIMAGTQASNRGPISYRSKCCRKSVSNSCE